MKVCKRKCKCVLERERERVETLYITKYEAFTIHSPHMSRELVNKYLLSLVPHNNVEILCTLIHTYQ